MQRQCYPDVIRISGWGLLVLAMVTYGANCLVGEAAHPSTPVGVCHGFVVLLNGYAVLSGIPAVPERGSGHARHDHTHSSSPTADTGEQRPAMPHKSSGTQTHLMDFQHGQDISPQADMLCVPMNGQEAVEWTAVSHTPALVVTTTSLKGMLTHNSRTNEAFTFSISRAGVAVEQAQVRLLVRMPHHDRRLPGGHGPANDPDVQGLIVQPDGPGRYTVRNVDFTMAGPWLAELQVHDGTGMLKVYLSMAVGED